MKKPLLIAAALLFLQSPLLFANASTSKPIQLSDTTGFSVSNDPEPRPPEDAVRQEVNNDGSVTKYMFDGTKVTTQKDGSKTTEYQDGSSRVNAADGSLIIRDAHNNQIESYTDGNQVIKRQDGSTVRTDSRGIKNTLLDNGESIQVDLKKNQTTVKRPDGTTEKNY